jgi:hypothetical protein
MCFWVAYPLGSVTNLQKTTSKSLLEMLQNTPNLSKNFCFYTEIFCIQKSENENFIFDLSKRVLATEKCNEMTTIISDPNQRPRVYASYGWKLL